MKKKMLSELTKGFKDKQEAYRFILKDLGFKIDNVIGNVNIDDRTTIECIKGHSYKSSYNSLLRGDGCKVCAKLKPYYEIKELLESEGYEILNKAEDFKGSAKTKMRYKCPNGHINSSVCSSLRAGSRCNDCALEKVRDMHRFDKNKVIELINSNGFKINRFIEEYKNCKSRVSVTCTKGHTYDTRIENVLYRKNCRICGRLNAKGENHYLWNGKTNMSEYMRSNLETWKNNVLKNSGYKCFITGKNGKFEVHHQINFSDILDETLKDLNLDYQEKVEDYGDDLQNIIDLCLKKHYEYELGIVMLKDIHKLFHSVYGIKNNTMEQVLEFKQDYLNGKFNYIISA